jgi:hypothetical protein
LVDESIEEERRRRAGGNTPKAESTRAGGAHKESQQKLDKKAPDEIPPPSAHVPGAIHDVFRAATNRQLLAETHTGNKAQARRLSQALTALRAGNQGPGGASGIQLPPLTQAEYVVLLQAYRRGILKITPSEMKKLAIIRGGLEQVHPANRLRPAMVSGRACRRNPREPAYRWPRKELFEPR